MPFSLFALLISCTVLLTNGAHLASLPGGYLAQYVGWRSACVVSLTLYLLIGRIGGHCTCPLLLPASCCALFSVRLFMRGGKHASLISSEQLSCQKRSTFGHQKPKPSELTAPLSYQSCIHFLVAHLDDISTRLLSFDPFSCYRKL